MRLKKIHRVISFNQSQWLKVYIDFNSKKRKEAKNSFEKNFFKLMVNSFFGKTCENVRNYKDIKLVISETRLKKLTSKPTFHAFKIFHLNLAAVQLRRTTVKLMKPRYIGFSILEISKCLMYSFHYHAVKNRYPNAKLLMTDTDSFCYHIATADLYEDLRDNQWIDFSNYPLQHPNFNTEYKMVVGKMKDETAGMPILEFVGLRSKMYAYEMCDGVEKKTAKGVKRYVTESKMSTEDFKTCLFSEETKTHSMYSIRHMNHVLYTTKSCKVSLSPYDDKRFLLSNIRSLSYGHTHIDNMIPESLSKRAKYE